jgi:DNA repair protein RecN (Recombination protein N)
MVTEAEIHVSEAADNLQRYLSSMDTDPARLEWVESRLAAIQDLARKHHVEARELPPRFQKLRTELDQLEHIDEEIDEMQAELERTQTRYVGLAKKLGEKRKKTAKVLAADVSTVMQRLGMPGGTFEIRVEHDADAEYSANGLDLVEFLVSTNPGQPPKSLRKVASGGELSRISLAIQVVAADATHIASLVFDEVDAGIGGGVAEIVGRRLRDLGGSHQVLCVTHLPQVASQAHHHFRVSKLTDGKTTRTTLHAVRDHEQVEELARMLGGIEITERTRAHAREMIAKADSAQAPSKQ